MKIGILTFPNSTSYGATLQMFALYQACQNLGYDTEIVNYFNSWMKHEKHTSIGQGSNTILIWLKRQVHNWLHICMKARFTAFENKMQRHPSKSFTDINQLPSLAQRYGAMICGSDQVWNPDITNEDLSFFLNFCGQKTFRISYAPSFGVESLSYPYAERIRRELENFNHLSIREESGKRLIQEISGLDAKLVVDPTFLLNAEQWESYENAHPQAKGEYILYYTIHSSPSLWRNCLELAKKTNLKILRIGSNIISKHFKKMDGVEYVCDIGPSEWLYLVHNAKYVVTNSFHGTAFSINFRRNFYLEFSSNTNSRLSNIVDLFGLENRVLREGTEITPSITDYSKTEIVLPKMKEESMDFLKNALHCAEMKQEQRNA